MPDEPIASLLVARVIHQEHARHGDTAKNVN
jgi:hypothetical protein